MDGGEKKKEKKTGMLHNVRIKIDGNCPNQISRGSSFLAGEFVHDIMWLENKIIKINNHNRHGNYAISHSKPTAVKKKKM